MQGKWKRILICFVLVVAIIASILVLTASADPFTAMAIGGLTGMSGFGLFGSMAGAAGLNINYGTTDPMANDAIWNNLNPDSVYFSGDTGTETIVDPITLVPTVYDYITLDSTGLHDAMLDNISEFLSEYQVTDNSSGHENIPAEYAGYPVGESVLGYLGLSSSTTFTIGAYTATFTIDSIGSISGILFKNGTQITSNGGSGPVSNFPVTIKFILESYGRVRFRVYTAGGNTWFTLNGNDYETLTPEHNLSWTAGTLNTGVFDGWNAGAKMSIPRSVSGLTDGFTHAEFIGAINTAWTNGDQSQIGWEEYQPGPAPTPTPTPIPDTNLGDVPFDVWVDLWGRSIEDLLGRNERQLVTLDNDLQDLFEETQGINDGVSDIKSLFDDLNQELNDIDDYFQTYGTDVLDDLDDLKGDVGDVKTDVGYLHDNVEDIEDEVIIIVDEMGNVLDVLEGIEAQEYANGQSLGSISSGVTSIDTAMGRVSTSAKQDEQTDILEDVQEAVEDIVPYVVPIPNIQDGVDDIADAMPDIKTNTDKLPDILTNTDPIPDIKTNTDDLPDIKDATQDIADTMPDIITSIQDATTTLTDDIPNIDDICENIDEAPYKDMETGTDRLPTLVMPYLLDLKDALGIWHYVVEWVGQLNSVLSFIMGVLTGTTIMTPIYASIAGYIVIKVYRRFGS